MAIIKYLLPNNSASVCYNNNSTAGIHILDTATYSGVSSQFRNEEVYTFSFHPQPTQC